MDSLGLVFLGVIAFASLVQGVFLVGLAFGLAYRNRRWTVAAVAVVLIGVLELMQFWAPGRHARLEDFLVDAATACVGFALAAIADWAVARLRAGPAVTSEGPAE